MARNDADEVGPRVTPVCAIGASAGGVQALRDFFRHVPDDLGLAYVVIIHLAPDQPSSLSEILSGVTRMQVQQVSEEGPRLTRDCVYVIPPDRELVIDGDDVRARRFTEPRGQRAPIDMFFRSVAAGRGDGLAVVLSGTGSDGALGVCAVKEAGGVVFVQEPADAEFPMMPRSALATGVADFVAPIPRLVESMIEVTRSKEALRRLDADGADADLRRIVAFLRARTGHDFSSYKRATVMRRVARRMQVTRHPDMSSYAEYLAMNPEEAQELFGDLLISVTHFFRDPEAYRALTEKAVRTLIEEVEEGGIRAWVVGCATGEEAYSLAILMLEEAERLRKVPTIQIFATDLDEGALGTAREGRYPASIEADVSDERLRRWFVREGLHYRIKKEVRDCVLFATHSVLKDPPFMRLDLISCRNLLIYLERELQRQVCTLFHYGLKPHGALFLGSAETVEMTPDAFFAVDREARLYRARPIARRSVPILGDLPRGHEPQVFGGRHDFNLRKHRLQPEAEHGAGPSHLAALEQAAPPSALVDHEHRILHLSPSAGRFMLPGGGPFSADITALVRPELRLDLRGSLRRALEHAETTLTLPLPVQFNGARRRVMLQVGPVRNGDDSPPHRALVFFLDGGPVGEAQAETEAGGGDAEVRRLRSELRGLEERLVASRQEHEGAIQDLRVANEELQSVNEEYRSTSEELETSKEELQSMNEELQTVNAELKSKLHSISTAHSDLQNLVTSTEIGTLFLDPELRIKMLTPVVSGLFNVTDTDIGRPITDFTHRLAEDGLDQQARRVLRDLVPVEHEVATVDGCWMMMRLRPYRTVDDRIDGVVVTFVDITARREAEEERELLARELSHRVKNTLAIVQALARSTGGSTVEEFCETFCGRLYALAQAHSMLLADDWRSANLDALVRQAMVPYGLDEADVAGGGRIRIDGERVRVSARQALSLSLVLHELGTNAMKHGALSTPGGRVGADRLAGDGQERRPHAALPLGGARRPGGGAADGGRLRLAADRARRRVRSRRRGYARLGARGADLRAKLPAGVRRPPCPPCSTP